MMIRQFPTHRKVRLLASVGMTILCVSSPAHAFAANRTDGVANSHTEQAIGDIIVTAQKRAEKIQDVPVAITAISGAELAAKGIATLDGALKASPSITIEPFGASRNAIAFFQRGQQGGGIYVDGFFLPRGIGQTFDLADVERVEVLRGPQGTLYGKNTTGGAINIISRQPAGKFGVRQTVDFGNRDIFRSFTAIDLPEWNGLSAKVTVVNSSQGGYVKNLGNGHDFGEESRRAARVQLHWDMAPGFTADYFAEIGRLIWTGGYYQAPSLDGAQIKLLDGSFVTYVSPDRPLKTGYRAFDVPQNHDRMWGQGLTLNWDISDAFTIKSLTGYHKQSTEDAVDFLDVTGYPIYQPLDDDKSHQFSQEIQIQGKLLEDSLRYVLGLYYFDENQSTDTVYIAPNAFGLGFSADSHSRYKSRSKAIFGQMTWVPKALDRRLEVTLGGRYTDDFRSGEHSGAFNFGPFVTPDANGSPRLKFDNFSPAFIVNYKWSDDIRIYAKVTTGYLSGGIYFTQPGFSNTTQPEKLLSYEVGLKSDWFDHRLRLNAAAYYNKYRDLQKIIPTGALFKSAAVNLGRVTIWGVDADLTARPIDDISLTINYSYLDFTMDYIPALAGTIYDNVFNPSSPYTAGDNIASLFTLQYAPKHSISASGDYTFLHLSSGDITAHVDYRWQSRYTTGSNFGPAVGNNRLADVKSYGIINGRLTLTTELATGSKATFSIWGKNIANKRYKSGIVPFTNGQIPGAITSANNVWNDSRSYGVNLGFEF